MGQTTGILVATPFHPKGTHSEWHIYMFNDVMRTQAPPGIQMGFYWRNHGEECSDAYTAIMRYAWSNRVPYVFIVEDDIFIPDGALQALFYELNKKENEDVGAIGGVYSWREGAVGKPFPLVFPKDGQGPKCDYTPGEVLEVDAAGQGFMLIRTHALCTQPEPWFEEEWTAEDSPIKRSGIGSDMFFFRKIRTGTAPNGKRWRILVHTGLTAEHIDRTSLEPSPPDWDYEYRERFGYARDSELLRRFKRLRDARGLGQSTGKYPSLISEFGMSYGTQPRITPPVFAGPEDSVDSPIVEAERLVLKGRMVPEYKKPKDGIFRVLNVASGGVQVRENIQNAIIQSAKSKNMEVKIDFNEHKEGAEDIVKNHSDTLTMDDFLIDDALTLSTVPDSTYDLVYASHCLEHFPVDKCVEAVKNWLRVLKAGGQLFIAVPDVAAVGQFVIDQKLDVQLYESAGGMSITPRLILNGGQRYPGDFHLNSFDMATLRDTAYRAGLSSREVWIEREGPYEITLTALKGLDIVSRMTREIISQGRMRYGKESAQELN